MAYFGLKLGQAHPHRKFRGVRPPPLVKPGALVKGALVKPGAAGYCGQLATTLKTVMAIMRVLKWFEQTKN